ncbi:MAG: protein kinase [Alphaproteobacteria bacterium]|nr:protein kinase [Alphaproteobacteria bacterium]
MARADDRRLGGFVLGDLLGIGGTARVWGARSLGLDVPVAIKVPHPERARLERHRRAIVDEARAAASLFHPRIALVVDVGAVTHEEAAITGIDAGTPYVVSELAHGGSLDGFAGSWSEARAALHDLLDALALAHAAGLVHRDVKPGNILRPDPRDARDGYRLTDFGLAVQPEDLDVMSSSQGTPAFMAPEQRLRRWREIGPWTDLFAVGRTAMTLLAPGTPTPPGLGRWLAWCLADEPAARFPTASDALGELLALGEPDPAAPAGRVLLGGSSDTVDLGDVDGDLEPVELSPIGPAPIHAPARPPRRPMTRLERVLASVSPTMLGARSFAPVGYEDLLEQLGVVLEAGIDGVGPRMVHLAGADDAGAESLAVWWGRDLAARGRVELLVVDGAAPEPLREVLAARLGTTDLDAASAAWRVATHLATCGGSLDDEVVAAVGGWIAGDGSASVCPALLAALARRRPLLVVVPSADRCPEELALLAEAGRDAPVITLAVASDQALSEHPEAAAVLRGAPRHAMAELEPAIAMVAVERACWLVPVTADRLVARFGGFPTRILAWLATSEHHLRPTADGLAVDLPTIEDDGSLVERYRALAGGSEADLAALAVLGLAPGAPYALLSERWRAVGADADELVARLLRSGVVMPANGRLSFVSAAWTRAAAQVGRERPEQSRAWLDSWPDAPPALRIRWSWWGGDPAAGLALANQQLGRGLTRDFEELVSLVRGLLAEHPDPVSALELRLHVAARERIRVGTTVEDVDALVADARALGSSFVLGTALMHRAAMQQLAGEHERALLTADEAIASLDGDDRAKARMVGAWALVQLEREPEARAALELAWATTTDQALRERIQSRLAVCAMLRHDLAEAERLTRLALEGPTARGNLYEVARLRGNLADIVARRGRVAEAEELARRAARLAHAVGHGAASATLVLGRILVLQERHVEAFHELAHLVEAHRRARRWVPLALTLMLRLPGKLLTGDLEGADADLRELEKLPAPGDTAGQVVQALRDLGFEAQANALAGS